MSKFYIATNRSDKEASRILAHNLQRKFVHTQCNSRWLFSHEETTSDILTARHSVEDMEDIAQADIIIYVNNGTFSQFQMFELEYSLSLKKTTIVFSEQLARGNPTYAFLERGFLLHAHTMRELELVIQALTQ